LRFLCDLLLFFVRAATIYDLLKMSFRGTSVTSVYYVLWFWQIMICDDSSFLERVGIHIRGTSSVLHLSFVCHLSAWNWDTYVMLKLYHVAPNFAEKYLLNRPSVQAKWRLATHEDDYSR
jgi:hypothetical protein